MATDSTTEVRMLNHDDGGVSLKLSVGAISIVAAISAANFTFLCAHCPSCPRRATGDIAACVEVLCPCREKEAA